MRLKGLDLNLLVAFDALMSSRSVSRAAVKMNLSQPAVSSALARLRSYFKDEILVVHGKRMLPTAFAEGLYPQVLACLREAEILITTNSAFDPLTSQRRFRIVASDYASTAVISYFANRLPVIAPGVQLELILPEDNVWGDLEEGFIDIFITPEEFVSNVHPAELLFEERHVIAGWASNPLMSRPISKDELFSSPHITVSFGRHRKLAHGDAQLSSMGLQRQVEIVAPSFTLVPWLLIGTQRLSIMHHRLAKLMAAKFPIAFQPMPFKFPIMREMAQYHSARSSDDGLLWLRNQLRLAAEQTEKLDAFELDAALPL
ncbi:hypothetical protein L288_00955 [Sphingobium quisquiliarum P25]|uniref:HTH lysR-type domain-containing protein n=1 Tax=Sphingobium quisquiliarum P25 TaxID=1329909 RepID=T0HRK4_9SPHN|nr:MULTISPECIES: LysR family transcriptional regulator [Sphingobium]EQB14753.1 hypothetical protein L288_00955 [Sphingobium quisquiliarum P25]